MATKAFKTEKIDAIKAKIEKAQVAVITEYQGLTVEDITKLRRLLIDVLGLFPSAVFQ